MRTIRMGTMGYSVAGSVQRLFGMAQLDSPTVRSTHNREDDVTGGMLRRCKGGRAASALSAWRSGLHG